MIGDIIFKLFVVFILSFLFGYQRQKSHKPVGFGTFIFVAIGSCTVSLIAIQIGRDNPLPLLAAIITGIGFLGAGALIRDQDKIFGFTTAASIWVLAIFGLTIGVGHYLEGIILYSFIWIIILFDKYLEKKSIGSYRKKIKILTSTIVSEDKIRELLNGIEIKKTRLISMQIDKKRKKCNFIYLVEGPSEKIKTIPGLIKKVDWLESLSLD